MYKCYNVQLYGLSPIGTRYPPSPKLARKLQWSVSTNLDILATFFLISLIDVTVHQKYKTHCQAAGQFWNGSDVHTCLPGVNIRTILKLEERVHGFWSSQCAHIARCIWQPHQSKHIQPVKQEVSDRKTWWIITMYNVLILF